jgi:hypothetical protein
LDIDKWLFSSTSFFFSQISILSVHILSKTTKKKCGGKGGEDISHILFDGRKIFFFFFCWKF